MSESKPSSIRVETVEKLDFIVSMPVLDAARALIEDIKHPGSFRDKVIVPAITDALAKEDRFIAQKQQIQARSNPLKKIKGKPDAEIKNLKLPAPFNASSQEAKVLAMLKEVYPQGAKGKEINAKTGVNESTLRSRVLLRLNELLRSQRFEVANNQNHAGYYLRRCRRNKTQH